MSNTTVTPELGPFQDMWDAWQEVHEELLEKPLDHFRRATYIQFDELAAHLASDKHDAAAREVIDIISIALNVMRWLGLKPADISDIARSRAAQRMKGQAPQILEKYQRLYHI